MARPTIYSKEIIDKVREYKDLKMPYLDEVIHSIEGLAVYAGIARSTLYKWKDEKGKEEFSDIFEEVLEKQGMSLFNNGLIGKFAPTITKVILTKHGYREGIETTGKDGAALIPAERQKEIDKAIEEIL